MHDGSFCTGHANNSKDMLNRLETMALTGALLPIEVIRKQIASAIDIIIHLSRMRDRSRRVVEISELTGIKHGEISLQPLFQFTENSTTAADKLTIKGTLQATPFSLLHRDKLVRAGFSLPEGMEVKNLE